MLKVSECSAPNSVVNNYRGTERGFYFPYGQLYRLDSTLVVAVWISTAPGRPKTLHFSTVETFVTNGVPEFLASHDNLLRFGTPLSYLGDLLDTGKRITAGT